MKEKTNIKRSLELVAVVSMISPIQFFSALFFFSCWCHMQLFIRHVLDQKQLHWREWFKNHRYAVLNISTSLFCHLVYAELVCCRLQSLRCVQVQRFSWDTSDTKQCSYGPLLPLALRCYFDVSVCLSISTACNSSFSSVINENLHGTGKRSFVTEHSCWYSWHQS